MMSVWAERSASLFCETAAARDRQRGLLRRHSSATLFLGADRAAGAITMTSAFVLGLIAVQVRYLTGSLWPAVVIHSSANATGTLLGILLRDHLF
jgi:membrane protease YdiL (CAAX protease family)